MPWSRDVPARDRVESEDHQRRSHPADWLCRACRRLPDVSCALSSVEPQGMIAPIVRRWMRRPAIGDSKSRFSPSTSPRTFWGSVYPLVPRSVTGRLQTSAVSPRGCGPVADRLGARVVAAVRVEMRTPWVDVEELEGSARLYADPELIGVKGPQFPSRSVRNNSRTSSSVVT